jgi:predicted ATPase
MCRERDARRRSFDSNEISVMQFYSPLTVIVGHNGSGKTVSLFPSRAHSMERAVISGAARMRWSLDGGAEKRFSSIQR